VLERIGMTAAGTGDFHGRAGRLFMIRKEDFRSQEGR
jgi:hypothetical protein